MPSVDTETQIVPMSGLYSEHGPLRPVLSRVKSSPAKNPGGLAGISSRGAWYNKLTLGHQDRARA